MYGQDWLVDRVRQHLDPAHPEPRERAVLVAKEPGKTEAGALLGHTILRVEADGPPDLRRFGMGPLGLYSTIYVLPEHRRRGVATRLLDAGEAWFRSLDLAPHRLATDTSATNEALIRLFKRRGFHVVARSESPPMVRMAREEPTGTSGI